jgi:hypothetical protein
MPKDASSNGDAKVEAVPLGRVGGVSEMQAKLHVGRRPILAAGSMTCSISCRPGARMPQETSRRSANAGDSQM